ncbi:helix-turn-helix transcriptional regulator [Desulforhopalus vacuolatus]|uniref:helix-turn-helix transcriptional regulator n=1 Tax=Desulforhopalus vacuolatus TaxID=40414 RepID=UPI0019658C75|nr:helix-turn-helix transcriptional regulator [Desulforhopalus vacuolatus]MBM9519578.1 helix-turn-helix transcriptional regulator [Desulforhopalus vacuolatus]
MSEENSQIFSPMAMVKIDGPTIKKLREQQGLTQLYVATAVSVTTDTISRWENGRYPSIKRENCIKLAETLGVPLKQLLLPEEEPVPAERPASETSSQPPVKETGEKIALQIMTTSGRNQRKKLFFAAVLASLVLLLLLLFKFTLSPTTKTPEITRLAPAWSLPEGSLPVRITIVPQNKEPVTLILKENIAPETTISNVFPETAGTSEGGEIRWLESVSDSDTCSYILTPHGELGTVISLHGSWATRGSSENTTAGQQSITLGQYHWADENQDHVIDDREIILVYDRYSNVPGFEKGIDRIEDIWLGVGYRWDNSQHKLVILQKKDSRETSNEK